MAGETFSHKFTSYFEGAAVLGGLIGMGWAIRERYTCERCLTDYSYAQNGAFRAKMCQCRTQWWQS